MAQVSTLVVKGLKHLERDYRFFFQLFSLLLRPKNSTPKFKEGKVYFRSQFVEVSIYSQKQHGRIAWQKSTIEEKQVIATDSEDRKQKRFILHQGMKGMDCCHHTQSEASVIHIQSYAKPIQLAHILNPSITQPNPASHTHAPPMNE